jgi:hypothetical protein
MITDDYEEGADLRAAVEETARRVDEDGEARWVRVGGDVAGVVSVVAVGWEEAERRAIWWAPVVGPGWYVMDWTPGRRE